MYALDVGETLILRAIVLQEPMQMAKTWSTIVVTYLHLDEMKLCENVITEMYALDVGETLILLAIVLQEQMLMAKTWSTIIVSYLHLDEMTLCEEARAELSSIHALDVGVTPTLPEIVMQD